MHIEIWFTLLVLNTINDKKNKNCSMEGGGMGGGLGGG